MTEPIKTPAHLRALLRLAKTLDKAAGTVGARMMNHHYHHSKTRAAAMLREDTLDGTYDPDGTRWINTARALLSHKAEAAVLTRIHRRQRAIRGWDDTAIWNLDIHLCATLSAQLITLASTGHGYPSLHPSAEEWDDELRHNAALLDAYAAGEGTMDRTENNARTEGGRTALCWVADNLDKLWD